MTVPHKAARKGIRPVTSGKPPTPSIRELGGISKQVKDSVRAWEVRQGRAPQKSGFRQAFIFGRKPS